MGPRANAARRMDCIAPATNVRARRTGAYEETNGLHCACIQYTHAARAGGGSRWGVLQPRVAGEPSLESDSSEPTPRVAAPQREALSVAVRSVAVTHRVASPISSRGA